MRDRRRMVAERTHLTAESVLDLFAAEEGYPTPKVDTRAAIFKDGKLLLVHKKNGTRSLPHMFHASIHGALRTASRVPYFRSSCFVLRPLSVPCALTSRMKKCKFPTRYHKNSCRRSIFATDLRQPVFQMLSHNNEDEAESRGTQAAHMTQERLRRAKSANVFTSDTRTTHIGAPDSNAELKHISGGTQAIQFIRMALAANADMFSTIKRFPKGDTRDQPAHACFLRSNDRQKARYSLCEKPICFALQNKGLSFMRQPLVSAIFFSVSVSKEQTNACRRTRYGDTFSYRRSRKFSRDSTDSAYRAEPLLPRRKS